MSRQVKKSSKTSREAGFTLLEYCAGAAVVIAVIWVGFRAMGDDIGDYLKGIGEWAKARKSQIQSSESGK